MAFEIYVRQERAGVLRWQPCSNTHNQENDRLWETYDAADAWIAHMQVAYPNARYTIIVPGTWTGESGKIATPPAVRETAPPIYVGRYKRRLYDHERWVNVESVGYPGACRVPGVGYVGQPSYAAAFTHLVNYVGDSDSYDLAIATFDRAGKELSTDIIPRWKVREQHKLCTNVYTPVPWAEAAWYQSKRHEHFAHVSLKEKGRIAFTPDASKGEADRQVVMNPGRYLTRYFSNALCAKEIERLSNQVVAESNKYTLKLATTEDECASVYDKGPDSCMAGHRFSHATQPGRVYGGPDLAVAYLGTLEKPTARTVCWPDKKRYVRIYGDQKLELLLQQAGYVNDTDMTDARIRMVQHPHNDPGNYIMPYFDFNCSGFNIVDDGEGGKAFEIVNGSSREHDYCEGTIHIAPPWTCPHCEDEQDGEDEQFHVIPEGGGSELWCRSCANADATLCDGDGAYFVGEAVGLMRYGRELKVNPRYAAIYGVTYDGKLWHRRDIRTCMACPTQFPTNHGHDGYADHCKPCGDARAERVEARRQEVIEQRKAEAAQLVADQDERRKAARRERDRIRREAARNQPTAEAAE